MDRAEHIELKFVVEQPVEQFKSDTNGIIVGANQIRDRSQPFEDLGLLGGMIAAGQRYSKRSPPPRTPNSRFSAVCGCKSGLNPPGPDGRLASSVVVGVSNEVLILA